MRLGDFRDDRETEPGAIVARRVAGIENRLPVGLGDSRASVLDIEAVR